MALLNPIILFCAIRVMLKTIKQHLRILMLKQHSIGNTIKNKCKNSCHEHPDPAQCWGQGATPGLWGGLGVVPISDFLRLAGMERRHFSAIFAGY